MFLIFSSTALVSFILEGKWGKMWAIDCWRNLVAGAMGVPQQSNPVPAVRSGCLVNLDQTFGFTWMTVVIVRDEGDDIGVKFLQFTLPIGAEVVEHLSDPIWPAHQTWWHPQVSPGFVCPAPGDPSPQSSQYCALS